MKKIYLILLVLVSTINAFAQLERKPLFGAQIEYVNENGIKGCKVLRVLRGTSKELKLQENDIIQQIGQSSFNSNDEFLNQFLSYSPGKEVQLQIIRGKKKMTLKGKAVERPYETDDNSKVIYDEAAYRGGQLRVIINKPLK